MTVPAPTQAAISAQPSWALDSRHGCTPGALLRAAVLLLGLAGTCLPALEIGDAVPPLNGVTWIKDQAIALKGQLTILAFWNTHTPVDILTHLSDLQHDGAQWVQVAALSSDAAADIRSFVDDQGTDMDYHVGRIESAAAQDLLGSDQNLPRICIIDGAGRLSWRGAPNECDSILQRLHSGTANTGMLVRLAPLEVALDAFLDGQHTTDDAEQNKALTVTEKMLAIDPINLKAFSARLWLAAQLDKQALALAAWKALPIAQLSAQDANALARERLDDENPALRYPTYAYACAKHAYELAPGSSYTHDLLARMLALSGSLDQAIVEQKKAVKLDPHDDALVATLDYYQELLSLRAVIAQQPTVEPRPAAATPP